MCKTRLVSSPNIQITVVNQHEQQLAYTFLHFYIVLSRDDDDKELSISI